VFFDEIENFIFSKTVIIVAVAVVPVRTLPPLAEPEAPSKLCDKT
jgi:hypothetical protein